jgi:hypothetical protein
LVCPDSPLYLDTGAEPTDPSVSRYLPTSYLSWPIQPMRGPESQLVGMMNDEAIGLRQGRKAGAEWYNSRAQITPGADRRVPHHDPAVAPPRWRPPFPFSEIGKPTRSSTALLSTRSTTALSILWGRRLFAWLIALLSHCPRII